MFPYRLKLLRKEARLSQKALAASLSISQQTVCKWEAGQSSPNPGTLARIAQVLGVTTDYLVGRTDSRAPVRDPGSVSEEEIKFALFQGDREISNEAYEEVKAFADFLRQKYKREM